MTARPEIPVAARPDILVAGGGLAGAAAAVLLAQAGRDVLLLEREAVAKDKVCGEFLSYEAVATLERLGLNVAGLGGEVIDHVRLVRGRREVRAPLPFRGLGISRQVLDEAVLALAAQAGAQVRRGVAVRRISDGIVETAAENFGPKTLLLATGKHETRGLARPASPGTLVGFKTYFRLQAAERDKLSGHVELILFAGGYAGLQPVEGGRANLCLVIEAAVLRRLGSWPEVLATVQESCPRLAARLRGAEQLRAPLSIARMPYGFVHRHARDDAANCYRLGDQAAVIPSFTGDGMAIALHSAALAARCIIAGEGAETYHRRLAGQVAGQIRRAGWLDRARSIPFLGGAWFYGIEKFPASIGFLAARTRLEEKEAAAF
ncbi:NAD(P)/FAD-dependent oxidoreductase [Acidocella sp.]|jgi:flavin-dependent dehydrogenase|uniref:NAD(P)/FAD-dependent oxidoreductase n=1 Tax=Acidocella sp. TaxID=50710 RepID=UPI002F3F8DCD